MADRAGVRGAARTSAIVGRLALGAARLTVRRSRSRWWSVAVAGRHDLHLVPATPAAARSWQHLVTSCGARPPAGGMSAWPLGDTAVDAVEWSRRCLTMRAAARRGEAYCYLVYDGGALVGEALGFVDPATSTVDLAVWLAPGGGPTSWRTAECVELLATHALAAPVAPARVTCALPADDRAVLDRLLSLGFAAERPPLDFQYANRLVAVTGHDAGTRSETA